MEEGGKKLAMPVGDDSFWFSRTNAMALMLGLAAGVGILAGRLPPLPQNLAYHEFADQRSWLGVPNFWNVISNLPFLLVGAAGMVFTWQRCGSGQCGFRNPAERWPYFAMFAGVFLTAFGSAYYHWAPGSARLVWDRLPMTIAFASLVAAVISERISPRWGVRLLPGFIALAGASVLWWYVGELRGNGDLRFYAAVQGYAALALLLAAFVPSAYSRRGDFLVAFALYAAAKILERADHRVFQFAHLVSGHSLKHLASAWAAYWLLRMLKVRRFKERQPRSLAAVRV